MDYLEIDITKKQPLTNRIYLRQGDGGIQKIGIQILKDGQPYSVTGYSLKFEGNLSDGKMVQGNATAEDASQGKFIYTFRNADSSVAGDMRNAYFRLYDTTSNALASRRLLVTVEKNADVTAGQAQDYISDVDDLVNETTEKLADNNQAIANQATQIADLQEALSDVSLHQAWMTGENGGGFSQTFNENLFEGEDTFRLIIYKPVSGSTSSAYSTLIEDNWRHFDLTEIKPTETQELLADPNQWLDITLGKTYTQSFLVRTDCDVVKDYYDMGVNWYQINHNYQRAYITKISNQIYRIQSTYTAVSNNKLRLFDMTSKMFNITTSGTFIDLKEFKIEESETASNYSVSPKVDHINCYPKYVGFGIKPSDNYQDYRWILNPEWAMANALYGTEMTTLKQQINRLQDLTEGE